VTPISNVNNGVKAFSIPANELSIFISAMQNKKAGKKLPIKPEQNTKAILLAGIFLKAVVANGSNITPAVTIRSAATWYAVSATIPTFINLKELPQIRDRSMKIAQLITLSFKIRICGKG
jgi:hypothetical protein